jgi:Predicted carbamoyl transferase, NodU family
MNKSLSLLALCTILLPACSPKASAPVEKPRVIVTCDPELDDHNSLIRYLLFSTDFDTEGLIYASSQFHWKGDGKGTTQYIPGREYARGDRDLGPQTHWRWAEGERFIDEDVEAYAKAYPNLVKHNPDYPSPEYLKSIIREGNVWFEGEMEQDTPGSDLIKQVLLDDDPRPVFIQVWGGPSTASRALKSIQEEFEGTPEWESVKSKVAAKAKFCLSGQQDQTYQEYVRKEWPEVESVILNAGVIPLGYGAKGRVADPSDTLYFSPDWTWEMIKSKGILGEMYRVWGDGKQMAPGDFTDYFGIKGLTAEELVAQGYWVWTPPQPEGNFISEGDTPMFLNLIGNGLRGWMDQDWGGWAGRRRAMSDDERAAGFTAPFAMRGERDSVIPDFVPAVQNNFAARMAWSVTPDFADANHEPVVAGPLSLYGKPGQSLKVKVSAKDPDGDALTCSWAQWKVTGSCQGDVTFTDPASASTAVTIPADAKSGDTVHLILTVSDNGTPQCTSYLRTVITVK